MASRMFSALLTLCTLVECLSVASVRAATFTVSSLADDGGSGELRAAITSANAKSGSTIVFQSGLSGTISLSRALPTIAATMTIKGPGAANATIDGAGQFRPFTMNSSGATVTISGLTIQHGSDQIDSFGGGGMTVQAGTLTLKDVTFSECSAVGGGGGLNSDGTSTLTNCTFEGNSTGGTASNGGGIQNNDGTMTLTNCTLEGNRAAGGGGAIFSQGATASLALTSCSIGINTANTNGGAVLNAAGTSTMTSCTLTGNGANSTNVSMGSGGAVYSSSGPVNLTNCTLFGNGASSDGGAVNGSSITLFNCTLSQNSAGRFGAAVLNSGTATITNCIVYGDGGGAGEIYNASGTAAVSYSNIQGGFSGTANINANPLLSPLADNGGSTNTMALGSSSPCFAVGTTAGAPTTDERGLTRPVTPSMGAYDGIGAIHTFPSGLTMISAPVDDSAFTLNQDFDVAGIVFAVWNPATDLYALSPTPPADTMRPGQGYWVRFVGSTILLDVGPHVDPTSTVTIPMSTGWNMIGCPRAAAVPMSSVAVIDSSDISHSFADAASSGLVEGTLFTYQSGDTAYEVVDGTSGLLNEYYGYWLYASQSCSLSLPGTAYPYAGDFQGTWTSQMSAGGTTTDYGTSSISIAPNGNVTGSFHSILSGGYTSVSEGTVATNGLANLTLLTNATTSSASGGLSLASGATQLSGTLNSGSGTIAVAYNATPVPGANGDLGTQPPAPGTYIGTWTSQTLSGDVVGNDHGTGSLVVAADGTITGSFLSGVSGDTTTVTAGTIGSQGVANLSLTSGGASGIAIGNATENQADTVLNGALTEQFPTGNGSIKMRYIKQ